MTEETLKILQSVDDSEAWESPPDFNYYQAMARVGKLMPELESIGGRPCGLDESVQDASFFTELHLIRRKEDSHLIETILAVRFSAFGNLFTTRHSGKERLSPTTIERVIKIVEQHGFKYIDLNAIDEPYTGQHEGFKNASWWARFFDYV